MSRPKEFDQEKALNAAIEIFREQGFEGASTGTLLSAMGISRQSLYDTFGDKWALYRLAVSHYSAMEYDAHLAAMRGPDRAVDGLRALLDRIIGEAPRNCLGMYSIAEFGQTKADLTDIHTAAGQRLQNAIVGVVRQAQTEGDIAIGLDPEATGGYLLSCIGSIRLAARGGTSPEQLRFHCDLIFRGLQSPAGGD